MPHYFKKATKRHHVQHVPTAYRNDPVPNIYTAQIFLKRIQISIFFGQISTNLVRIGIKLN